MNRAPGATGTGTDWHVRVGAGLLDLAHLDRAAEFRNLQRLAQRGARQGDLIPEKLGMRGHQDHRHTRSGGQKRALQLMATRSGLLAERSIGRSTRNASNSYPAHKTACTDSGQKSPTYAPGTDGLRMSHVWHRL